MIWPELEEEASTLVGMVVVYQSRTRRQTAWSKLQDVQYFCQHQYLRYVDKRYFAYLNYNTETVSTIMEI